MPTIMLSSVGTVFLDSFEFVDRGVDLQDLEGVNLGMSVLGVDFVVAGEVIRPRLGSVLQYFKYFVAFQLTSPLSLG